jgi:hypothetical protein
LAGEPIAGFASVGGPFNGVATQIREAGMYELIKSFGRKIASFHNGFDDMSEERYVSQAGDLIDLELSAREFRRHRATSRRILGGACRY